MNIYAIGDLHLSYDDRVEKPMDIFGDQWANHGKRVEENWLKSVGEDDLVIISGDVSWGLRIDEAMADFQWLHRLPGRKIVTKGNHDLWWTSLAKMNRMFDDITFLQNNSYSVDGKTFICGTRGWICPGTEGFDDHDQKIFDREKIRLRFSLDDAVNRGATEIIVSLHYPPTNDKKMGQGFADILEEYGVKTCVYGHLHGKEAFKNGLKGVLNCVEYRLVSLDYLDGNPLKIR